MKMLKRLVLAALLPLAALPAHATILFAGGEDVDFSFINTPTVNTTTTQFDTNFAREAISVVSGGVLDPPSPRFLTAIFSNQSTIWIHAENIASSNLTNTDQQSIGVYGSDGVRRLMIRATGVNNSSKISKRDGAGTFTDLVTCAGGSWPLLSLNTLDWFIHYAVAGEVTLYINNVQVCDFIGDVTTNSVTAVNQVDFSSGTVTLGQTTSWSEIVISTADTRGTRVWTLAPNVNGNTAVWSGSCNTSLNNKTINDTQFVSTTTSAQLEQCTLSNSSPPPNGPYQVQALVMAARVLAATGGPQNFQYSTRTGGADFASSNVTGNPGFANYPNYIQATNPNTGIAWTMPDLEDAALNIGLKSQP